MSGRRVLIIEDNPDAAEALAMMLRGAGHSVAVAASGLEGLAVARAFRPEVVVCDIRLPGELDGIQVARALRSQSAGRGAVLIGLSGLDEPSRRALAVEAGFDHYLVKPAEPPMLLGLVDPAAARG